MNKVMFIYLACVKIYEKKKIQDVTIFMVSEHGLGPVGVLGPLIDFNQWLSLTYYKSNRANSKD